MDDDSGLFDIEISDDESVTNEKVSRDFQSEEDFDRVRRGWTPKVEGGEIVQTLRLPLTSKSSKVEVQSVMHAVEILYFRCRYEEAAKVIKEALAGDLRDELRQTFEVYHKRCVSKLRSSKNEEGSDRLAKSAAKLCESF